MILAENLPDTGIEMKSIDAKQCFALHAKCGETYPFYIHNDGSLVIFFEIPDWDSDFNNYLIDILPFQSSLQMYLLNEEKTSVLYGCIKVAIDYSSMKTSFRYLIKMVTEGADGIIEDINQKTAAIYNNLLNRIEDKCRIIPIYENYLSRFLVECSFQPKSNVSVVMNGPNRCSSLLSISNITDYTFNNNFPHSFKYPFLSVLTVNRTSELHEKKIENYFNNVESLIDCTSKDFHNSCDHEIREGKYYVNMTLMINAFSLSNLDKCTNELCQYFTSLGIIPYIHTNTTSSHYISCFPGNGEKVNNYQLSNVNGVRDYLEIIMNMSTIVK